MDNSTDLFKENKWIHPKYAHKKSTDLNLVIYQYLLKNNFISKDMMNKLGVGNIDLKVKNINKGGRFLLISDRGGWIIEK